MHGTLDNSQAAILENLVMRDLWSTANVKKQLTAGPMTGGSPSLIGWSLFAAMAALNVVMFVRIGHHLKELRG